MSRVNQMGDPVEETTLYPWGEGANGASVELDKVLELLCLHLGVTIVRTNATKHGVTEIVLKADQE